MEHYPNRTWAEIDLGALADNYKAIRSTVSAKVMAMIKGDAYGHGAVEAAKVLHRVGADYFGVATIEEAVEIRQLAIETPILIMGYTAPEFTADLIRYDITQTVTDMESAMQYADAARAADGVLRVHIKLDTGMGREGIVCKDRLDAASDEAEGICRLDGLHVEGIYTHFCTADAADDSYFRFQAGLFTAVTEKLEQKNIRFEIKHCANSASVLKYPCVQFDMVRAGILLYGLSPDPTIPLPEAFRPVMTLKSAITQVKTLDAGSDIGYGRTYTTLHPSKIAVLPIGYADGLPRLCSNRIRVGLKGQTAPVVGRICMDLCMLDVTDTDAARGDTVTIFGWDKGTLYPVEDVAKAAETISYEIVTCIGKRVPRVYIR